MSPGHPQPSGLGRCEENRFDLGSCEDRLAGLGCRAKVKYGRLDSGGTWGGPSSWGREIRDAM